jgi:hypothetical protein
LRDTFDAVVFSDIAASTHEDAPLMRAVTNLVGPSGILVIITPSNRQLTLESRLHRVDTGKGFSPEELKSVVDSFGLLVLDVAPIIGPWTGMILATTRKVSVVSYFLQILLFPFLMVLTLPDIFVRHTEGDKLLLLAMRRGT